MSRFASGGLNRGRSGGSVTPIFDHIEFERRRYRSTRNAVISDPSHDDVDAAPDRRPVAPSLSKRSSTDRRRPSRLIEDGAILRGRTTVQTGSGDGVEHPQTSRGLRPRWARSHCVISVATFEPLCRSG